MTVAIIKQDLSKLGINAVGQLERLPELIITSIERIEIFGVEWFENNTTFSISVKSIVYKYAKI